MGELAIVIDGERYVIDPDQWYEIEESITKAREGEDVELFLAYTVQPMRLDQLIRDEY